MYNPVGRQFATFAQPLDFSPHDKIEPVRCAVPWGTLRDAACCDKSACIHRQSEASVHDIAQPSLQASLSPA